MILKSVWVEFVERHRGNVTPPSGTAGIPAEWPALNFPCLFL
jgi:hypothetical protein